MPEPDADQAVVGEALARRGVEAELCVWNDPAIDWASYALCLLRTPWDYYRAPDAFLAWLAQTDSLTRLQNPLRTVRWNVHKSYLLELAREG
ncbi:MAG: hypothetical protein GWN29_12950, partial [Gammaproteobacteria bacterium]|nr:hypothetical protein [Gammaproteobacteria bacterium]